MISETDLKLLKSERMTDFADGGGKMTSNEVVDGQMNNVFDDISQLDRTYGRISLRKIFASVATSNTDMYLGAHAILTDPPDDPNVNVTLFSTASWTDERDAIRDRIESFSVEGPELQWVLYGDHVIGQRLLAMFSMSNALKENEPSPEETPEVGHVLALSVEKPGYVSNIQFVRVTRIVSRETNTFVDTIGAFRKDVLLLEISNPLRILFIGAAPYRFTSGRSSPNASPTVVRSSTVADAAEYYGVKPVLQPLSTNQLTVEVGSPYVSLVPSAQAETPLVGLNGSLVRPHYVLSSNTPYERSATLTGSVAPDYEASIFFLRGFSPGGVTLTIGGTAYKDDAAGNVVLANGQVGDYTGVVDYAAGKVTLKKTSGWTANVAVSALPAVAISDNAGSAVIYIALNNRAYNYVKTLQPLPSPGSLLVSFKALNKWYVLYDDGLGHLYGTTTGIGVGSINYATGAVIVTLGALPDVDSAIIFTWATPVDYTVQTYVTQGPLPALSLTLAHPPFKPETLFISWMDGGNQQTAETIFLQNANGDFAGVALVGQGSGGAVPANGDIYFIPATIPPSGAVFTFEYEQVTAVQDTFSVTPDSAGVVTFTLTQTPVGPASVGIEYSTSVPQQDLYSIEVPAVFGPPALHVTRAAHDDGYGKIAAGGEVLVGSSVNYTTGVVVFGAERHIAYNKVLGFSGGGTKMVNGQAVKEQREVHIVTVEAEDTVEGGTTFVAKYSVQSALGANKTENIPLNTLTVDLSTTTSEALVEGSIAFSFAGTTYIDRQGILYRDVNPLTNSGAAAGSIDYQTGIATLTSWNGGSNILEVHCALSIKGQNYVTGVYGRTPGSPVAVGQFEINCVTSNGVLLSASADNNGNLSTTWVKGHVDWLTGVYDIAFGTLVDDTLIPAHVKASSGWYDPADVISGHIWAPRLVKPESILINTVLVSYIPLDASILGVDTVRLPQDGKVPIFKTGNVVVVHNTQTLNLPDPAVAGSTHSVGRTLLSYAKLFDANGAIIPTAKYSVNLDAGTLTYADPLNLTGYVQPLKVEHRIEDMSLVTDVQITGQVTLMKPLRHAYPANTSFLSSALVIGDMQARVTHVFDQQTWTNVWSDNLIGTASSASYNAVLYPITVTNAGTMQERWALVFTGATAFNCYGEFSGLVAQGSTGTDFSPVNPITGAPYFTINLIGWGAGWASGNVLRFNTQAANFPLDIARTTLQSNPAVYTDNFKLQIRGDAN